MSLLVFSFLFLLLSSHSFPPGDFFPPVISIARSPAASPTVSPDIRTGSRLLAAPAWVSLGSHLPSRLSPTAPSPGRVLGPVWLPVDRSASLFGAGSLAPGCGGHCARCRVFKGAGGVCRFHPCGSRGWYGARGLTPSPYPVGCPRGGNWEAALDGPREEPLEADSVALFCHPFPRPGVCPLAVPPQRRDPAADPSYLTRL